MKTFLTLLILHYIVLFLRKKKGYNTLSCGLFGWVGDDTSKFNKDKFDKLGIYNVTRGKHSCGIAIDGKLNKGIGIVSEYQDYIAKNIVEGPKNSAVVIGHTRHATVGSHTLANAHPFKFDYGKEGYVVGAHNGTLINHKQLAKKYGVSEHNIDSQILLEIISKDDKNIKVLEEYYGAAALLFHSSDNPNTLYIYRGKSKQATLNYETEERPLFYYQESEGSMYISSLKEALYSIMECEEDKDNIFEVTPNKVYQIEGGKITAKLNIDRSKAKDNYMKSLSTPSRQTTLPTTNTNTSSSYLSSNNTHYKNNNIFYEKPLVKNANSELEFSNLRFKKNGNLVTGIYVFFEEIGYVKLCKNLSDIEKSLKNFTYTDRSVSTGDEKIVIGNIKGKTLFYIYDGILLELPEDYEVCTNPILVNKTMVSFDDLSEMAMHPIIDLSRKPSENTVISKKNQKITKERRLFTGTLSLPGTTTEYIINNGNLVSSKVIENMIEYTSKEANTIDLYSYIPDVEDEDDEDDVSFENSVKDLVSSNDLEELDTLIEIVNNYDAAIEGSKSLANSSSKISVMMAEASDNIEKTLEPILNALKTYSITAKND